MFPGGHPSKYWLGSMLLNFSDRTRTGVFNMIWPLARAQENVNILFQQHTYLLTYMRFGTQVRLKCWLELRLLPQLPTGFLSVSSSLKPLFPCFEHFYARNIAKIRLRLAIWGAFSSLRIQICSVEAGFKTREISYVPLINAIPTPADTLKGLRCNYFLLISMYLLRQYIY